MLSEIKLLAGTKVYYCFNSNVDNFKVKISRCCQKQTIRQRQNVLQYLNRQSMALKIVCSNPTFTLDFVRKCRFCAFNEHTDNSKED